MKASVLIVEDNVQLATCLEMLLEANSFEVSRTSTGHGGLQSVKLMDFDVILCDLVLPGMDGYQLLAEVERIKPHLSDRFVFMSGHPSEWATRPEIESPVLRKPFCLEKLLAAIGEVTSRCRPGASSVLQNA